VLVALYHTVDLRPSPCRCCSSFSWGSSPTPRIFLSTRLSGASAGALFLLGFLHSGLFFLEPQDGVDQSRWALAYERHFRRLRSQQSLSSPVLCPQVPRGNWKNSIFTSSPFHSLRISRPWKTSASSFDARPRSPPLKPSARMPTPRRAQAQPPSPAVSVPVATFSPLSPFFGGTCAKFPPESLRPGPRLSRILEPWRMAFSSFFSRTSARIHRVSAVALLCFF